MSLMISNQANHVIEHYVILTSSIIYFICLYIFVNYLGTYVFPLAQIVSLMLVLPLITSRIYTTFSSSFIKHEMKTGIPALLATITITIITTIKR